MASAKKELKRLLARVALGLEISRTKYSTCVRKKGESAKCHEQNLAYSHRGIDGADGISLFIHKRSKLVAASKQAAPAHVLVVFYICECIFVNAIRFLQRYERNK
ncbi:unnamed protein product [Pieris brassicae]|uniref:Uncharacterized protein n=1 Tax=Pieris brassicae TaxID=7116 RepID=A0A9P0THG9_PIEBR|nr:unnamed protein product [Pieris brassicae]